MVKVSITFDYTNQYGWTSRENIIANVKTNEEGYIERKTILEKIKSYGYAKTRVSDLIVTNYDSLIYYEFKLI